MRPSLLATGLVCSFLIIGCSDGEATTDANADSDSATGGTDTGSGSDSDVDTDSDTTTDTDSGSASDSDTTGEPDSPYDGEPLPEAETDQWQWIDFPDAFCRDGSTTGIGVRYGLENKVMIFFQGGGACFNPASCTFNRANYDGGDFANWMDAGGREGVLDADNPDNPLGEWSVIYIPYCTGDVHAGDRPDASLPGVGGTQQFVGYRNVEAYLNRIVPTFFDAEQVLVTGVSAGGFGAALNFDHIANAFTKSEVTLIDDSGPPMADPYLAPCLQSMWRDAWGFDMTLPQACDGCFPDNGGGLINLVTFIGEEHSDSILALISSEEDGTIRGFFGFGSNDCKAVIPNMKASLFTEGLYDLRDNALKAGGAWGSFFLPGEKHTWIGDNGVYSAEVSDMLLIDWITDILVRDPQHISP
ncbi:MAG TPA: hypothetical protein ENK31_03300 [Nannocystis exedens]|nr:hypothetical protein [Nannocystis exedens]